MTAFLHPRSQIFPLIYLPEGRKKYILGRRLLRNIFKVLNIISIEDICQKLKQNKDFFEHTKPERILYQKICTAGNVKESPSGKRDYTTRWKFESTQKSDEHCECIYIYRGVLVFHCCCNKLP